MFSDSSMSRLASKPDFQVAGTGTCISEEQADLPAISQIPRQHLEPDMRLSRPIQVIKRIFWMLRGHWRIVPRKLTMDISPCIRPRSPARLSSNPIMEGAGDYRASKCARIADDRG